MRIGRLRDSITIQKQTDEQTDYGGEKKLFNDLFAARANIKVISGVELLKAGVASNTEVISILMRYDSRIEYDHVVLFKTAQYEISSIKPDDKYLSMIVSASRTI